MKQFYRSLRYLWPYRLRIGVALVCVLCVAALWGGGLGMILPGAKVLISPEGLHGWAYNTVSEDRLGVKLVRQSTSIGTKIDGQPTESVIDIVSVDKPSVGLLERWLGNKQTQQRVPATEAHVQPGEWIVGVGNKNMRSDELAKTIARWNDLSKPIDLRVYSNGVSREVAVTLRPEKWTSHLLGQFVQSRYIPDPSDSPDPNGNMAARFPLFMVMLLITVLVTAVRGFFTFLQEYFIGTAVWRGIMDLRSENYNVVLHLPTTFFSEKGVSDATSRFMQDTGELARGQNTLLGKTMVEPAKAIACFVVALYLNWQLTLGLVVAGPPAYWIIHKLGKKMHKASKRALESWSTMLAALEETLQGIRVVKAYTMEGAERRRFFRINRQLLKQQNRMERLDALTGPMIETLGILGGAVAGGFAGWMVFKARVMDTEVFLTWIGALFALFDPVRKLAKVSLRFHASDAAAKRIFELMDAEQEPRIPNAPSLARHSKSIQFDNVTFCYPGASSDAVKQVTLTANAGQTVAIVGPNGSGKTTLLSLLPRLINPTSGTVRIDGTDISQVSVRSLRRQIGLVTQDAVLFHATIAENISYGLRRAKRDDVIAVAKKAFVDEFVRDLPAAYDTMVGEHGTTLSGGQRQRIAIARAMLRDPSILIFDEAMSQIDSDSERRIHESMTEFSKGRTTLLIAHRFATVLSADMIVVMNEGRIIDTGTHKTLLERCELYQHLYKTQFAASGG